MEEKTGYPLVSVLIVNYNGGRYAEKCLESLRNQTYRNREVIVFDNASSDDSVAYIGKNFPEIKIVTSNANFGFAKAANEAETVARGEYLFFLNMDTWFERDLLEVLVSTMRENTDWGICGCTQLGYDSSEFLNSGSTTDYLGYPMPPDAQKGILYADGASLFVTKPVFDDLGGFDSEYFMYGEEVDLCWRALIAGYDVGTAPSAIIRHKTGGTVIKEGQVYAVSRNRRYLYERNSLRTLLKNYSLRTLLWALPMRIIVMFYEYVVLAVTRHTDFAEDIGRAMMWNFQNAGETLILRQRVQESRRTSDRLVMRRMRNKSATVTALIQAQDSASSIVWT